MPLFKPLLVLMFMVLSTAAYAQDAPSSSAPAGAISSEKRMHIEQLLEVTGALQIAKLMSAAVTRQITDAVKQARPDIPAATFDTIADEVNNVVSEAMSAPGGFVELIIPVYDKHFTTAELDALIAFYKTPVGIKTVSVMPQVTQEAMQIGRQWGQSLGPVIAKRVQARLREQGIEL